LPAVYIEHAADLLAAQPVDVAQDHDRALARRQPLEDKLQPLSTTSSA
jgi:hypothetical protein